MNGKLTAIVSTIATIIVLVVAGLAWNFYEKVEAGYVGVRVNLLGSNKGVSDEVLGVGRYFIGWNEELFKFPTFQQTYAWTTPEGRGAFQFQSREGLSLQADVSLSYTVKPEKVSKLFQTYRKGLDEITKVYLYNLVRDSLVQFASTRSAESLYGAGKNEFIKDVTDFLRAKLDPVGISIDYVAIVGNVWLPHNVKTAIDEKVKAGQLAAQRETEVATARAEAEKTVATAEGQARSKKAIADANAYAILTEAKARKQANELLNSSISPNLIEYNKIEKWDGKLPNVTGGAMPLLNVK